MKRILVTATALLILAFTAVVVGGAVRVDDLEKACDGGDARACVRGAHALLHATLVRADDARAGAMLTKACAADDGDSCANLGYLVAYGRYGNDGVREAVRHYEKGCELNSSLGCTNLAAVLAEGGWGVEADPTRALAALRKACGLGDDEACEEAKALARTQPAAPDAP
jgi:TPR repeat protein